MRYEMICTKCAKESVIDVSLKQYEEMKPFKCKGCGGDLERDYRTPLGIKTVSSPSRVWYGYKKTKIRKVIH